MARTPLLRGFRKLAEEHRTAGRLGIPPAELRGQREEAALSRREFLKRAGATGAAVARTLGEAPAIPRSADNRPSNSAISDVMPATASLVSWCPSQ